MTDSVAPEDWTVERYREGDERDLLELFTLVFNRPRTREHWNWQFRDNPHGGPFVTVARGPAGQVAGAYSVTPISLNVMGRPVPGCQSVDTAVHPDWRNQRVFERTATECYAWCQEAGIQAVVGFPNARSYPGFMRTLDWRRVSFPRQYVLRLGGDASLRRLGLGPLARPVGAVYRSAVSTRLRGRGFLHSRQIGSSLTFTVKDKVPDDYERLWSFVRSQEVLAVWKDADYLEWRYDRNPDHEFRYALLHRGNDLLALAVLVDLDSTAMICEFMVAGRDVPVARLFLNHIAQRALRHGSERLEFIGHDIGFFEEAFDGFERRLSTGNVFCGRSFVGGKLGELLPLGDNWTVTFGDGDFV